MSVSIHSKAVVWYPFIKSFLFLYINFVMMITIYMQYLVYSRYNDTEVLQMYWCVNSSMEYYIILIIVNTNRLGGQKMMLYTPQSVFLIFYYLYESLNQYYISSYFFVDLSALLKSSSTQLRMKYSLCLIQGKIKFAVLYHWSSLIIWASTFTHGVIDLYLYLYLVWSFLTEVQM